MKFKLVNDFKTAHKSKKVKQCRWNQGIKNHLSMLSPRQEERHKAYAGHLTWSVAFPTSGNLTISLGPCFSVETFDFFARRNGIISLCGHLKIIFMEKNTGVLEVHVSTCFEQNSKSITGSSHYSNTM